MRAGSNIRKRLNHLEKHLKEENPVLVSVVDSFRRLDKTGYAMGLLDKNESFATQISWWPLISVLGTFSAGKSTFINHYLGGKLQETGNQAVDDKFTVVCYSREQESRVLPGIALDADPRFPFYQISEELDKVAPGEGGRVDAYLQLKTIHSEQMRGRILIDSPGFDADAQRSATLRLTRHIVDLSDLVLVFFDARHPEPGAMVDTLTHLVKETISRADSNKFLYVLNQIDTTAREDNPEDVYGAWQRALAQEGLTAGRFYSIYNPDIALQIDDEALKQRFESKRDVDLAEIHKRMENVSIDRAYRIIGALEKNALDIQDSYAPQLVELIKRWTKGVLRLDVIVYGTILAALLGYSIWAGYWQGMNFTPSWLQAFMENTRLQVFTLIGAIAGFLLVHFISRKIVRKKILASIKEEFEPGLDQDRLSRAFFKNTRFWRSIFNTKPVGWGRFNRSRIRKIMESADQYVQKLNDRFTDPSGSNSVNAASDEKIS
ncbi:MAG: dynamin family protein [Gammaproteobacteria bacterium]